MSIHTSSPLEQVIGRVFRNTRAQDASYAEDMNEWIPEAMGYMKTRIALVKRWQDVNVRYHKGRLPCGLVDLLAVQWGNCRLPYLRSDIAASVLGPSTSTSPSVYPNIPLRGTTPFGTHLVSRDTEDEGVPVRFFETDLESLELLPNAQGAWYYTELDYINTSFADDCVRIFYKGIPVDSKGFPLIPDDEYYKEAIYWYCRAKMIGCGYEDKVFTEAVCMDRFETNASRAMSRITRPTVDEQEAQIKDITRFILPENVWHLPYR